MLACLRLLALACACLRLLATCNSRTNYYYWTSLACLLLLLSCVAIATSLEWNLTVGLTLLLLIFVQTGFILAFSWWLLLYDLEQWVTNLVWPYLQVKVHNYLSRNTFGNVIRLLLLGLRINHINHSITNILPKEMPTNVIVTSPAGNLLSSWDVRNTS